MKVFTGKVISKKMQKTATVAVERVVIHPVYKKRIKKIKEYHVHDESGTEIGQVVRFAASKPFSKTKKWKIIKEVETIKGREKPERKILTNALDKKINTGGTEVIKDTGEKRKTVKRDKRKEGKK